METMHGITDEEANMFPRIIYLIREVRELRDELGGVMQRVMAIEERLRQLRSSLIDNL